MDDQIICRGTRVTRTSVATSAGALIASVAGGHARASSVVAAGLGVSVRIEGQVAAGCVAIGAQAGLPDLGHSYICLYDSGQAKGDLADALRSALQAGYGAVARQ